MLTPPPRRRIGIGWPCPTLPDLLCSRRAHPLPNPWGA